MLEGMIEILLKKDWVTGIWILDGPYSFCLDIYKVFSFYTRAEESNIKKVCNKFASEKVHYAFKIYDDERQKRIELYESVDADVVILLDTDEFPVVTHSQCIQEFWRGSKNVANLRMLNIASDSMTIGDMPLKRAIFKKEYISAENHLNYTWLVGVTQEVRSDAEVEANYLLEIFHFTLLRPRRALHEKFIFYTCLWFFVNHQRKFNSASEYLEAIGFTSQNLAESTDLILDSLISTDPDYLGLPRSQEARTLSDQMSAKAINIMREFAIDKFSQGEIILRSYNMPVYLRVHDISSVTGSGSIGLMVSGASYTDLSVMSASLIMVSDGDINEIELFINDEPFKSGNQQHEQLIAIRCEAEAWCFDRIKDKGQFLILTLRFDGINRSNIKVKLA